MGQKLILNRPSNK